MGDVNYKFFMQSEPRENLGPIRLEHDKIFGRRVKVRDVSIGMTRNASKGNRKTVKAYLEPYPHIRIDKAKELQGWYKGLHEKKGVRSRPCYTEAMLTEPYGGFCSVGCIFCYINSGFRGYRGTGLITVPMDYSEQVKKQLSKVYRGSAGYITAFSDPFLPLEDVYHNSQAAAQQFVDVGLPIFFLSRLKYPDWAIELLTKNRHSYAQKSINTPSPTTWKKLSPGALGLGETLKEITKIKKRGIYVSIQCNPIIPGVVTHDDMKELFRLLAKAGADHVIVKFVEAGYSWAPTMIERMIKRFGEKGEIFADLFCENVGGQRCIAEEYRINAHKRYKSYAKRYGLTYSVCYEYKYERDNDRNVVSKTGISLAPDFTTSAQCHGQRVPVYKRTDLDKKFKPVRFCPPSGCLYCASDNGGEPRCGDQLAGEARALTLADMRKPWDV